MCFSHLGNVKTKADPWCRETLPTTGIPLIRCRRVTRTGVAIRSTMQSSRLSTQEHLQMHLLSTELNPILGEITTKTFTL